MHCEGSRSSFSHLIARGHDLKWSRKGIRKRTPQREKNAPRNLKKRASWGEGPSHFGIDCYNEAISNRNRPPFLPCQ